MLWNNEIVGKDYTLKENENRILRWDKKQHTQYGPENKGKWITNTNPTIEINPMTFDRYTEIDPPNPNASLALNPKQMRQFLKDKETPKHKKTFIGYIPGLVKGMLLEKTQNRKNNKVKIKKYETYEEKLQLKQEILEELERHNLIGALPLLIDDTLMKKRMRFFLMIRP